MSPLARIRQAAACSVLVFVGCWAVAGAGPALADEALLQAPRTAQGTPVRLAEATVSATTQPTAVPPAAAATAAPPAKPVQLAPNVPAQIAHSALLSVEATAKPDALQISIRRVNDKSLINTDDVTVAVDGKNQSVTRERGTVYELPINDLRGDGARDVDVTVAHDGIREIVSGKVTVAEASTESLWRDHKQVAWWILNILIVLVAAWAFSGRKSKSEEEKEEE